jgi:hypothetical protein
MIFTAFLYMLHVTISRISTHKNHEIRFSRWFLITTFSLISLYYFTVIVPALPLAPIKLFIVLGPIFFLLHRYKKSRQTNDNLFSIPKKPLPLLHGFWLFIIPIVAESIYQAAKQEQWTEQYIRETILYNFFLGKLIAGTLCMLWAMVVVYRYPSANDGSQNKKISSSMEESLEIS